MGRAIPNEAGSAPETHELALRLLAPRALTAEELRRKLLLRGQHAPAVDRTLERLAGAALIDDAQLAYRQIVARAERPGLGPRRLVAELVRRGVPPAVAQAAWERACACGEVDPGAVLDRRVRALCDGAITPDTRALARVYRTLVRAGFEPHAVRARLSGLAAGRSLEGIDDDVA